MTAISNNNRNHIKCTPHPSTREQWLQQRQEGIGGSEVGTVLSLNPYESRMELFRRKIGLLPIDFEDNMQMLIGRETEEFNKNLWKYSSMFEEEHLENFNTGKQTKWFENFKFTIKNAKYPYLLANVDGLIQPKGYYADRKGYGILEAKNMASWVARQWEDGIPPYYKAQTQTYLMISEYEYGEMTTLVDGRKQLIYEFERDEEMIAEIITKCSEFWKTIVQARKVIQRQDLTSADKERLIKQLEPKPDGSIAWEKYQKERYKTDNQKPPIMGTDEMLDMIIAYKGYNEIAKTAEDEKRLYSNQIKEIIGESHEIYFAGNGSVTWKADKNGTRTLRIGLKHYERV